MHFTQEVLSFAFSQSSPFSINLCFWRKPYFTFCSQDLAHTRQYLAGSGAIQWNQGCLRLVKIIGKTTPKPSHTKEYMQENKSWRIKTTHRSSLILCLPHPKGVKFSDPSYRAFETLSEQTPGDSQSYIIPLQWGRRELYLSLKSFLQDGNQKFPSHPLRNIIYWSERTIQKESHSEAFW